MVGLEDVDLFLLGGLVLVHLVVGDHTGTSGAGKVRGVQGKKRGL